MNKNLVYLFSIALVVALIVTGIFYGLFIGQARPTVAAAGAPQVVVAKRSLNRGTVLKPEDVKMVDWPSGSAPADGFARMADTNGLTVIEPIQASEPVLQTRVTPLSPAAASGVPKGMRAVSVHVLDSGGIVAMLRTGQHVDVQVINTGPDPQLRTILQDVEVLNVPATEGGRPVVNLIVKPEDAGMVGLADSVGRIRLALRNPNDNARVELANVAASAMMRGPATAPAAGR